VTLGPIRLDSESRQDETLRGREEREPHNRIVAAPHCDGKYQPMKMHGTPKDHHSRLSRWWLVGIGLVVVPAIIGLFSRSAHVSSYPNDILRDATIQGIQGNIAKLSSAALVWRSESISFGPWADKPKRVGDYQLWWDGRRTAISCTTCSTTQDPNGQISSDHRARFITYDGKEFRVAELPTTAAGRAEMTILKRPRYRPGENYLRDVGWQREGGGLISEVVDEAHMNNREPGTYVWSIETGEDGSTLITREFHNSKTGQVGLWTYDTEKAYGLVVHENNLQEGKVQSRNTIAYGQVSGDIWFPVSVVTETYSAQTGELLVCSKMEVDVDKSIFNDPAALPEDVFELEAGPNTEVQDLTSLTTKLKMLMNDI
jgi:hypothetical protein